MNPICKFGLGTLAVSAVLSTQASLPEVADEIDLGGSSGIFSSIDVSYLGSGFSGNESLTLNLYLMDGPTTPASGIYPSPGTLLFSSTVPLGSSSGTATFTDPSGTLNLSGIIGVGLVFNGIEIGSEEAGPALYDPPTVPGSSFDDYWSRYYYGTPDWEILSIPGIPVNFGLNLAGLYDNTASPVLDGSQPLFLSPVVPEPGTWVAMIGFGAIVGSMAFRRIRGSV